MFSANEFVIATEQQEDHNKTMIGGGFSVPSKDGDAVSELLTNLTVPAGIFIASLPSSTKIKPEPIMFKHKDVISDDIYDRLVALSNNATSVKNNKHTRRLSKRKSQSKKRHSN
jgi:hypothetical protein